MERLRKKGKKRKKRKGEKENKNIEKRRARTKG